MKKFLYFAAALSLLAVSCKEEIKEDVLEVVSSSTVVGVEGTTQKLEFTTNNPWTISSEKDWVTFDVTSGEAGSGVVTMTVSANDTYDSRTSKVTIKSASKSFAFTVTQFGKTEFGTSVKLSLSSEEQDITIPVQYSVEYDVKVDEDAADWLSVVQTKASLAEGTVIVHVAANTSLTSRSGSFEISTKVYSQKYVVEQKSVKVMTKAEAVYLGSLQDIYDEENYAFNTFRQFAVILSDDDDNKVVLTVNATSDAETSAVPAGSFVVDDSGKHSAGTFSLKSPGGHEKYYTGITVDGSELVVIDGDVKISGGPETYSITATLYDESEVDYSFSYQGAISVADKSFGAECTEVTFAGQYNTYFAGGAQEWKVSLLTSGKDKADNPVLLRNIYLTVYGTPEQTSELPVGEFKYEVPEIDATIEKDNGVTRATPQTFSFTADNGDWVTVTPEEGTSPSLSIAKNEDGTYTFSFSVDFVMSEDIYDDDNNVIDTKVTPFSYDATFESVYLPEPEIGLQPTLDGDAELNSVFNSQYHAFYYGHVFDESNDVFVTGFTDVNNAYAVYLSLNVKGNYTFEKNFNNRFCNTPFETGTFNFSKTGGDNTLIPLARSNVPYLYIKNTYTGTVFYITSGSVTFTDKSISYDLTAKPKGGSEIKFTGSHDALFYFAQDYTKYASNCKLFSVE